MALRLHPHQREAVDKMHNGCVLYGDVGTGKTITALAYAAEKEVGKQIVIVTTAKVRDSISWDKEAAKLMMDPHKFEVWSWNKIHELVDRKDCFFIFDEQRLVGTGAWVKSFHKIVKQNEWILLSATPGDTWEDYSAMFIANGWYDNITAFRREHAVYSKWTKYPKIERWLDEPKLERYRKRLLVEMPMLRKTERQYHYHQVDYDVETLDKVRKNRWNVYEDKPAMNAAELFGVMRKVVSSDPARAAKMEELFEIHPRLIVFYNYNYELEMLRDLCVEFGEKMDSLNQDPSREWKSLISSPSSASLDTRSSIPGQNESTSLIDPPWEINPTEEWTGTSILKTRTRTTTREVTTDPWVDTVFENGAQPEGHKLNRAKYEFEAQHRRKETSWESKTSEHSPTTETTPAETAAKKWTEYSTRSSSVARPLARTVSVEELISLQTPTSTGSSTPTRTLMPPAKVQPIPSPPTADQSFSWAEWNGHKHEEVPTTDRWIYLVQYTSGSEGWNCVETDAIAFWSLTYSWKAFWQAQGRTDRLNTLFKYLHYHILISDSLAEKPVLGSLEVKEDFQPR